MKFRRLLRGVAVLAVILASDAAAFDYARYKGASLDEILERQRPPAGADIYRGENLRLDVTLVRQAYDCNTGFLKRTMMMTGIDRDRIDKVPMSKCIQVKSPKGQVVQLFIQNVVAEFLAQEVSLGSPVTIFVLLIFMDTNGPGMLVNEFDAGNPASRQPG